MPATTVKTKAKKVAPRFRSHRRWCSTCARTRDRKVVAVDLDHGEEGMLGATRIDSECPNCKNVVVDFISPKNIDSMKAHHLLS